MNPTELVRAYNGSDANMTESARVIHQLLVVDLNQFTAFDNTITIDFASDFLTAIDNADSVVADTAVIDIQAQKTAAIKAVMEKAKTKYADVKYFAKKAFPTSANTQYEFGLDQYKMARRGSTKMIQFLVEMHKVCVKYKTELGNKGLSESAIAEIQSIKNELQTTKTNQGMYKKQRPKLTKDRIAILNHCYEFLALTNAAAQRIYIKDAAKQKQFVFRTALKTSSKKDQLKG